MHFEETPRDLSKGPGTAPWHRELTKYHWFVLIVAALGWLFDTMDQQLFNLARRPAMVELLSKPKPEIDAMEPTARGEYTSQLNKDVAFYSGVSTTVFMIGWALGGIAFGILGDKIGRAKTMLVTILVYSIFTGLSALSTGFWMFSIFRLLTGLGVGGEFAVGVALVAEVMPDRARPYALGRLQALSAVGNMTAAAIAMVLGKFEETGAIGSSWRIMFVIGTLPALLAIVIRRKLKEPERWQAVSEDAMPAGSIREMFGTPRWRKNTIVGMLLAFSGVVGLWGIGFFSFDLMRVVFTPYFKAQGLSDEKVRGALTMLTGLGSFVQNLGGFFGVEAFTRFTQRRGRKLAFAVSFPLAMVATAFTFLFMGKILPGTWDVFWMLPIMGFCQLTLFGGYAIYLPELYPTRLRSTGTSFCYNVGRLVAAIGPLTLGSLAAALQPSFPAGDAGPFRYAGLIMCSVFVVGMLVLPFAPETKDQPLPE